MTTVLFVDIDSTLIENRFSGRLFHRIVEAMAAECDTSANAIRTAIVRENQRRQLETPNDPATMDWEDIVNTVARQLNIDRTWPLTDDWAAMAQEGDIQVLDNAHAVMQSLKQPHRKLVIATKGLSAYQLPVLDAVGLTSLFDDILTPDRTGYLKTEPGYFDVYRQNGVVNFIQIGDHYYDDVICARRNGFKSILRAPIFELKRMDPFERPALIERYQSQIDTYPEDGTDVVPDALVLSLEEVPAIVDKMEQDHAN